MWSWGQGRGGSTSWPRGSKRVKEDPVTRRGEAFLHAFADAGQRGSSNKEAGQRGSSNEAWGACLHAFALDGPKKSKQVKKGQVTRGGGACLHAFADDRGEPPPVGMVWEMRFRMPTMPTSQVSSCQPVRFRAPKAWPRIQENADSLTQPQRSALNRRGYLSLRPLSVASSAYVFAICTCALEVVVSTCTVKWLLARVEVVVSTCTCVLEVFVST